MITMGDVWWRLPMFIIWIFVYYQLLPCWKAIYAKILTLTRHTTVLVLAFILREHSILKAMRQVSSALPKNYAPITLMMVLSLPKWLEKDMPAVLLGLRELINLWLNCAMTTASWARSSKRTIRVCLNLPNNPKNYHQKTSHKRGFLFLPKVTSER